MPASSRKRNKGKDRKARQKANKEESNRAAAREMWQDFCCSIECNHGCDMKVSDDHPVSAFVEQFIMNLSQKGMQVSQTLFDLFEKHPQVWNNEDYRRLAINILVRIGTNALLCEGYDTTFPLCIAHSVVVLEHYEHDGSGSMNSAWDNNSSISKRRDFEPDCSSIKRDVLKFYRKRTSCKCLKKMHLEARKTTPKMGLCWHCKDEGERAALSVCSQCMVRCMVRQYCSRKCQIADWPEHKIQCDMWR